MPLVSDVLRHNDPHQPQFPPTYSDLKPNSPDAKIYWDFVSPTSKDTYGGYLVVDASVVKIPGNLSTWDVYGTPDNVANGVYRINAVEYLNYDISDLWGHKTNGLLVEGAVVVVQGW